MRDTKNWLLGLAIPVMVTGCSQSPELARGPIQLNESPTVVRFAHPVPSVGALWEICFEFELPGDSHHAGSIHAVLVSTSGHRYELSEPELDRRGEHRVCQIGRVAPIDSSAGVSQDEPVTFESIELSTAVPVRLRGLRGGSR